jgi:hypothetical protein
MLKHQRHNAAANGQQILLDLQKYVLFFLACGADIYRRVEMFFWAFV